jgi:large subunit ribosomal protein L23
MALFSSDDNTDDAQPADQSTDTDQTLDEADSNSGNLRSDDKPAQRIDNSRSEILIEPYITEKATYKTDDGIYTFVVQDSANKPQIKQAVRDVYGVSVEKVRTMNMPKKQVESWAGKTGSKGGGKKAYVHLKEGDSIDLM